MKSQYEASPEELTRREAAFRQEEMDDLEQKTEDELDELVHDLKSQEAAAINNQGKEAQIAYILGN